MRKNYPELALATYVLCQLGARHLLDHLEHFQHVDRILPVAVSAVILHVVLPFGSGLAMAFMVRRPSRRTGLLLAFLGPVLTLSLQLLLDDMGSDWVVSNGLWLSVGLVPSMAAAFLGFHLGQSRAFAGGCDCPAATEEPLPE